MVHLFFRRLAAQPHLANQYTYDNGNYAPTFSQVFRVLFPNSGRNRPTSYLNAISNGFGTVECNQSTTDYVTELFYALGMNPSRHDNQSVFHFWCYLNELYWTLVSTSENNGFHREDHIFGFMSGFNLHRTKVVIIAADPSHHQESSGYAFHLSKTPATRQLLDNLSIEMGLMDQLTGEDFMSMGFHDLADAKDSCNLTAWIDQGVLLLNSWLTHDEPEWAPFTNFLVEHLSGTLNDAVFILMGQVAFEKVPLIDKSKHLVLRVHHPSHAQRRTHVNPAAMHLEWDRVLPFINANFYLYQAAYDKGQSYDSDNTIDWVSTANFKESWPNRWEQYIDLFHTLASNMDTPVDEGRLSTNYWDPNGQRALVLKKLPNGRCIMKRHPRYEID